MRSRRAVIVGYGRLGGALARALRSAGWSVSVRSRRGRAKRDGFSPYRAGEPADLCFLTVPDRLVSAMAQAMDPDLPARTPIIHCAGALPLSALQSLTRHRGSFHPLCAVSDPTDLLAGCAVGVAASTDPLLKGLLRLARQLKMTGFEVDESRRGAYHAAAVLAAGGVVALLAAAADAMPRPKKGSRSAIDLLLPLTQSALRGVARRGLSSGITGPVARGDAATVAQHLAELPADVLPVYRLLMVRSLAASHLLPGTRAELLALLAAPRVPRT